jgi:hypothetical protein
MIETPFITDIVQDVISKMDYKLKVVSVTDDTDVKVCDLRWSMLFNQLIVNDEFVDIVSVDNETNTIVLDGIISLNDVIKMPNPFYLGGTRYATNKEWIQASERESDKLPLIWLSFSPNPTERQITDKLSSLWSTWQGVTLFFCDNYNSLNWITADQVENKIKPLRSLALEFTDTIDRDLLLDFNGDISRNHFPIFGTENSNGIDKRVIDAELSAVKLAFNLDVYKNYKCCKK